LANSDRFPGATAALADELKRLEGEIRAQPADAKLRTYLFQLLAVQGAWARALNQLQVAAQLSAAALPMAQTYREAIRAEVFRVEVFAGRKQPSFLGKPPQWAGLLLEALKWLGEGHVAKAEELRATALEDAPASPGKAGDTAFDWIADADSRLGPVCEAVVDGKYVWVPFENLAALKIEPPTDLRDLVWAPARLRLLNGGDTVALIPARYPGSEASDDDAIRMGRRTDWRQVGDETYIGLGQKMWATDAGEYALLETRDIALGTTR
jgi:type VI secretion system protein ImpE